MMYASMYAMYANIFISAKRKHGFANWGVNTK